MNRLATTSRSSVVGEETPRQVCFLIDNLYAGGTEIHLLKLIEGLDRSRVNPILVLLDGKNDISRNLEPTDCEVVRLGISSFISFSIMGRVFKFARFLRKRNIDTIHMCFPDSTLFGTICGKLAGVPNLIRTRRNAGYWMTKSHEIRGRLLSRWITRTIANSEISKQSVIRQERANPDTVEIIPNGVDLSKFSVLERNPVDGTSLKIGMVANLRPVKRISDFIDAAERLLEDYPQLKFDIAGDGELREQLQEQIDAAGIAKSVQLHGAIDNIPEFLGELDVVVSCSESEGLSNTLLEAMASGLPVVATDIDGNRPLVKHGESGFLFPVRDVAGIVSALRRLIEDSTTCRRFGHVGRRIVEESHDQEKMVRRYVDFYCDLPRRLSPERMS